IISPALFALWGAKLARRGVSPAAAESRWHRLAHAVLRRPGAVALVTATAMLAVAAPALTARWSSVDDSVIPKDKSARTVADELARGDAGKAPIVMSIDAPPSMRAQVSDYAARVRDLGGVQSVASARYLGHATWQAGAIAA